MAPALKVNVPVGSRNIPERASSPPSYRSATPSPADELTALLSGKNAYVDTRLQRAHKFLLRQKKACAVFIVTAALLLLIGCITASSPKEPGGGDSCLFWNVHWRPEDRRQWQIDCQGRDREAKEEERQLREQERKHIAAKEREAEKERRERERADDSYGLPKGPMRWGHLSASGCIAYDTREYSAVLHNIPRGVEWRAACEKTPVTIHDVTLASPTRCEDHGIFNGEYGFWRVAGNESSCRPNWGELKDKGCKARGAGLRHIESRLWNIHDGDWSTMCSTTPISIKGYWFDKPTYCANLGPLGVYGVWVIEDPAC
ncbi:hypothetical protein PLICRDRAFT_52100 [Plicaturopsis crispa FD-325 SS-3]|nr:hypothetical protein PLICRDRAFT_52100 [Plicaturopsis crispa FD-325 SS-3]